MNQDRTEIKLRGSLADGIANDIEELSNITFASGFGRITDIKVGPDGYLYVLSSEDKGAVIYKIVEKAKNKTLEN